MNAKAKTFIIAIDGPAASGKGTLARKLATHYHLPHLDTGLTYRAVAYALLQKGLPLDDEKMAVETAQKLDLGALDATILSAHHVGEAASKVAVMPQLREALVRAQRRFAHHDKGAVLDGRDIGTVVCPDANVKLYIIADATARAQRRYDEILSKGGNADFAQILKDLEERDARDMNRKEGPLKQAQDAHLLNTTNLGIEAAFKAACALVEPIWQNRQH